MVPGFCSTVETLAPGSIARSKPPPVAVCGARPLLTQVTVSPARAFKLAGLKPVSLTRTVCLPGLPGAAGLADTAAGTGTAAGGATGAPAATGGGALPAASCTMTVPFIPPWSVQVYGYVPALVNVNLNVPVEKIGLLNVPPFAVTLCAPSLLVQVTVPPTAMVTEEGLNALFARVTDAVAGARGAGAPGVGPGPPGAPVFTVTVPWRARFFSSSWST